MTSGWDKYKQVKETIDDDSSLLNMIARAMSDYELNNLMDDVCQVNGIDLGDDESE